MRDSGISLNLKLTGRFTLNNARPTLACWSKRNVNTIAQKYPSVMTVNLFRVVDKMGHPAVASAPSLPSLDDAKSLANRFADFFYSKITKLRKALDESSCPEISVDIRDACEREFSAFNVVSEDTVQKTILESATKSCSLDPSHLFRVLQELSASH